MQPEASQSPAKTFTHPATLPEIPVETLQSVKAFQSDAEREEESRKIIRLQTMMSMVMSVLGQDSSLTIDEASEMVADCKRAALALFPDKELAYNLIYRPRLQRLMRERYRMQ